MTSRGTAAGAGDAGEKSPGLRLNRRMKDILATGLLPSLSPSALTVLHYAAAYGDFTDCKVFLGAKTIAAAAFKGRQNRNSVRHGIAELLDVGLLVEVKPATYRRAAVYRIALVTDRVVAAQDRVKAVGARRRRAGEGGHGCTPRGVMGVPPGGSCKHPQGGHGSPPNHSLTVPSSLRERVPSRRLSRRSVVQVGDEHEQQLKAAAVKKRRA
jgi:hypothetical protein